MSRIEKGGTRFKPTLPRTKALPAEKPRSSTAPRSQTSALLAPLEDFGALSARDVNSSLAEPLTIDNAPVQPNALQTVLDRETQVPLQQPSSTASSSGHRIAIPSIIPRKGNVISMPGQRRIVAPSQLTTTQTINETTTVPQPEAIQPEVLQEPESVTKGRQGGQKRKAIEPSDAPEPSSIASKRRRTDKQTAAVGSSRVSTRAKSQMASADGEQTRVEGPSHAAADGSSSEGEGPFRRQRKPRPRVDKAVQEVPEEGDPIDETTMTMKDLCNGMGQGRVSGRYLETFMKSNADTRRKREANTKLREVTRRKELGLPLDEEEAALVGGRTKRRPASAVDENGTSTQENGHPDTMDQDADEEVEDDEEDEYGGVTNTTARAPKVRYDGNGNLVLDETELEYDRQAEADAEFAARGPVEVVVETDRDKFTNFASYARKPRPDRWSKEETETFYLGLRMFHTGFDLIARLLPNRTRTMVRNKFKAEDRKNPQKITNLLSHKMRLPYDLDLLARETGHDFSGPIPQVDVPLAIEANNEGDESGKEDESVKQRMSTAPLSGGESDRGDATSVSTGRGRSTSKGKGKRKASKSTSKPPSSATRGASVADSGPGEHIEVERNDEYREPEDAPRPPTIGRSRNFTRVGVPAIRSAGPPAS